MGRITNASLEARFAAFDARLDRLESLIVARLEPAAPAKEPLTVTFAREEEARDERIRKGRTSARKSRTRKTALASGDRAWDGTKADRKRWNDTLSKTARGMGYRTRYGKTLYAFAMDAWTYTSELRAEGLTPKEALSRLMSETPNERWSR